MQKKSDSCVKMYKTFNKDVLLVCHKTKWNMLVPVYYLTVYLLVPEYLTMKSVNLAPVSRSTQTPAETSDLQTGF